MVYFRLLINLLSSTLIDSSSRTGKKNDKLIWEMVAVHPPVFSRQGWFPHPRIMLIFWGETSKLQRIDLSEHRIWMYPWNPMVYFKIKHHMGLFPPFTDTLWRWTSVAGQRSLSSGCWQSLSLHLSWHVVALVEGNRGALQASLTHGSVDENQDGLRQVIDVS